MEALAAIPDSAPAVVVLDSGSDSDTDNDYPAPPNAPPTDAQRASICRAALQDAMQVASIPSAIKQVYAYLIKGPEDSTWLPVLANVVKEMPSPTFKHETIKGFNTPVTVMLDGRPGVLKPDYVKKAKPDTSSKPAAASSASKVGVDKEGIPAVPASRAPNTREARTMNDETPGVGKATGLVVQGADGRIWAVTHRVGTGHVHFTFLQMNVDGKAVPGSRVHFYVQAAAAAAAAHIDTVAVTMSMGVLGPLVYPLFLYFFVLMHKFSDPAGCMPRYAFAEAVDASADADADAVVVAVPRPVPAKEVAVMQTHLEQVRLWMYRSLGKHASDAAKRAGVMKRPGTGSVTGPGDASSVDGDRGSNVGDVFELNPVHPLVTRTKKSKVTAATVAAAASGLPPPPAPTGGFTVMFPAGTTVRLIEDSLRWRIMKLFYTGRPFMVDGSRPEDTLKVLPPKPEDLEASVCGVVRAIGYPCSCDRDVFLVYGDGHDRISMTTFLEK